MQTDTLSFRLFVSLLCLSTLSTAADAETPALPDAWMCIAGELLFSESFDPKTVSERWGFKADFALRDGALLRTNVNPSETKRVFLKDPSFHNTIIQFDFKLAGKTTDLRLVNGRSSMTEVEAPTFCC